MPLPKWVVQNPLKPPRGGCPEAPPPAMWVLPPFPLPPNWVLQLPPTKWVLQNLSGCCNFPPKWVP